MDTYFDAAAADRVCNFITRFLVLPETGKPFTLPEWLRDALRKAYGTKHADGTRVVRTLYLFVPKKNAKSSIGAALALYHLCADGEQSGEVYSVAGDRAQASIIFEQAKKMAISSPKLCKIIRPYRYSLLHEKSGSKYAVVSADATTKEGVKARVILFDELHVQPDRRLWDALRGSGLARSQPMTTVATTAGDSKTGIGWEVVRLRLPRSRWKD